MVRGQKGTKSGKKRDITKNNKFNDRRRELEYMFNSFMIVGNLPFINLFWNSDF